MRLRSIRHIKASTKFESKKCWGQEFFTFRNFLCKEGLSCAGSYISRKKNLKYSNVKVESKKSFEPKECLDLGQKERPGLQAVNTNEKSKLKTEGNSENLKTSVSVCHVRKKSVEKNEQ